MMSEKISFGKLGTSSTHHYDRRSHATAMTATEEFYHESFPNTYILETQNRPDKSSEFINEGGYVL